MGNLFNIFKVYVLVYILSEETSLQSLWTGKYLFSIYLFNYWLRVLAVFRDRMGPFHKTDLGSKKSWKIRQQK